VKLENDRGLPDMHRRRAANFQQFFTPFPIVHFLTKALALDASKNLIVLDNACGIGGMFRYLPDSARLKGIELEKKAYETAIKLFATANIINDSLIHHIGDLEGRADVALINPPFSIHIEKENLPLENAQWGALGPKSSIQSHIAAVEIALRSANLVGAMLPEGFFRNEGTRTVERWINQRASLLLKVEIPGHLFKESGFEWPCSVVLWQAGYNECDPLSFTISGWDDLDSILQKWTSTPQYRSIRKWVEEKAKNPSQDFTFRQKRKLDTSIKGNACSCAV
jgi:predicted RNA methylase